MTFFCSLRRLFLQRDEAPQPRVSESIKTEKAIQAYDRMLQSTTTNVQLRDRSLQPRAREP